MCWNVLATSVIEPHSLGPKLLDYESFTVNTIPVQFSTLSLHKSLYYQEESFGICDCIWVKEYFAAWLGLF